MITHRLLWSERSPVTAVTKVRNSDTEGAAPRRGKARATMQDRPFPDCASYCRILHARRRTREAVAAIALAAVVGCSSGGVVAPAVPAASIPRPATTSVVGKYIKHVVIIVQENRSFDNFFEGYPGADYATSGQMILNVANARPASGSSPSPTASPPPTPTPTVTTVPLQPIPFTGRDIEHTWHDGLRDWDNGKMDGFGQTPYVLGNYPAGKYVYSYVEHSLLAPYWSMAHQYVLADHMFSTMYGQSFTAHLDLIAGTANLGPKLSEADVPSVSPGQQGTWGWGCDAPPGTKTSVVNSQRVETLFGGPFPCFTQFRTMADTLDAARVSWKYYAPSITEPGRNEGGVLWSAFQAIADVCRPVNYVCTGSDWKNNVISPPSTVLTDPAKGALASVSWVIPDFKNSDHAVAQSDTGPSWVGNVVNAIGKSPYWNSTAIIVVWDDWGGWYDHVPPPQISFVGLGERVPCLIISPYAKPGYVSHTQYEFGSILKFVEEAFNLPYLNASHFGYGYSDERATSIVDSFDFTQKPTPFVKIKVKYPASHFLSERPSLRAPDDN
jgi:phospholipase C